MCRPEKEEGIVQLPPVDQSLAAPVRQKKAPWSQINGRVVDLSAFKHPGGNIIDYFYELDGTTAFESFHGHSKKAQLMLASLPTLDKEPQDMELLRSQTPEHVAATTRLFAEWKDRGMFKPNPVQASVYGLSVVLAIMASWALAPHWPVLAGLLVGTCWAHCGFLQHMGGHRELGALSLPWQNFFEGLCKGGSATWWRNRHNKHHAKTNVLGEDGDLRTTPFFAWDSTLAKKCQSWSLKTQAFTFIPALGAYVFLFAFTVRKFVLVRKLWVEAALMVAHYAMFVSALRYAGASAAAALTYYTVGYAFQGIYLGFFFALSHFAVERVPSTSSWAESSMKGTVNWANTSAFAGYVSGFLNVQIEHHMAPQMPMENLRFVCGDCEKLAKELGLPYRNTTFLGAVKLMLGGLYTTGKEELARRKSYVAAAAAVLEKMHTD